MNENLKSNNTSRLLDSSVLSAGFPSLPACYQRSLDHDKSSLYDFRKSNIHLHHLRDPTMGRVLRFALLFCAATLLMGAGRLRAQETLPTLTQSAPRFGGPQDWSTQSVIYTRNGSVEDMLKLRDDPRFLHSIVLHYMREHRNQIGQPATAGPNESGASEAGWNEGPNDAGRDDNRLSQDNFDTDMQGPEPTPVDPIKFPTIPSRNKHSHVDWSVSLGPNAGLALGGTPAVYTYSYTSPSCSTLTATPPVVGDFIVYTVNATPVVGTQANLVGLTNLYTAGAGTGFCSGTGPSFLFSYAIGSGGSPLSPVLSRDGTKVAWIENRPSTTPPSSYLHVTTWAANDGGTAVSPIVPTGTFSSGVCTPAGTSCDDAIEYTAATPPGCSKAYIAANTHSDIYVDYGSDSGFVSANNGLLYHIKNIFSTTTAPSVDFCVAVNTTFEGTPNAAMSGPLYDPLVNEVFITDSEKIYAYVVNASGSAPSFSPASNPSYLYGNTGSDYNNPTGTGIMLDAYNGFVYVFSTYDGAGDTSVTQLPTSLASAAAVELGSKSTNSTKMLFYGAFDNHYYNYGPANAASTLYSCGTAATATAAQNLFAINFNPNTGVANATPAMSSNQNVNGGGTANGVCSPITEFYDGTNDRIFVGMGQPAATTGANIVTMWNVNSRLTSSSEPTVTSPATYLGGTSGFAADIVSSDAQAQNIYFSTEQVGTASTTVTGGGTGTAFNVNGIYTDGTKFPETGGLDDDGNAYSHNLLGASVTWNGTTYNFGPTNQLDAWQATTITLPAGQYSTLSFLANTVNGNLPSQEFIVTYTDGTTTTLTQSVSDWYTPQYYPGEAIALTTAYRDMYNATKDDRTFNLYGYSFGINANKTVQSLTLPGVAAGTTDNVVVVLGIALSANCGGEDYCAVKLTQSGLQ
jgi:hypothetical protein